MLLNCCGPFQNDKQVTRIIIILFCTLLTADCFGQFKSISDFYEKMFEVELFKGFNYKYSVPMRDYRTRHDTTRIDTTYTMTFEKHPNLDKSSGGGRLEKFNSIYADSTSVYEVSHRLYISFNTMSEGETFLENLLLQLRPLSYKVTPKKTDIFEQYTLTGKEVLDSNGKPKSAVHTTYPCIIVLRLMPNRQTNQSELYIGL